MRKKAILVGAVVVILLSSVSTVFAASFQGLGVGAKANAISADGKTVVGRYQNQAISWKIGEGISTLGFLNDDIDSEALDVSEDGSVIVGWSGNSAFKWTTSEQMIDLGNLPNGNKCVRANGVSNNGEKIIGVANQSPFTAEAYLWTENTAAVGLGSLNTYGWSGANGISGSGTVAVGVSLPAIYGGHEACQWIGSTNSQGLGDLELHGHPYTYSSSAIAASYDGTIIVGRGRMDQGSAIRAVRWVNGDISSLGDFPGGHNESEALDVSGDGSIVIGCGHSYLGKEAFVWDSLNQLRNLKDVLRNDYGLDLNGWMLSEATGISADGLTIVGQGVNPDGYNEGWIVTIPEPATLLLLAMGVLLTRKRKL